MTKARELSVGDAFRLHVTGEVVQASPVADGKRIKIKILLEHQTTGLEFLDSGCVLEFICKPGRVFCVWNDDDDDDDRVDPDPVSGGSREEVA